MSFNDGIADTSESQLNLKGVSGKAAAPEFASDEGVLKGIGGGKGKSRTPRPIKPPGVYVNGKAVSKAERKKGEVGGVGTEQDLLVAGGSGGMKSTGDSASSLAIDSSALEEFKELATQGSAEYSAYLDFSVQARTKLEGDVFAVLQLLEDASQRATEIAADAASPKSAPAASGSPGSNGTHDNGDKELVAALEARHVDLEAQLTDVWDELLIKDEGTKKAERQLDDAKKEQLSQAGSAGKEIAKLAKELTAVKEQVTAVYAELEGSRAQAGALHEQVDALTQKLQMEESSKKSLKAQLEKVNRAAQHEAKRAAALQEQVSESKQAARKKLRAALALRHLTSSSMVFALYCQARWLQMCAAARPSSPSGALASASAAPDSPPNASPGGRERKDGMAAPPPSSLLVGSGANPLSSSALLLKAVAGKRGAGDALARELEGKGGDGGGVMDGALLDASAVQEFVHASEESALVEKLASLAQKERTQRSLNAQLLSTVQGLKRTIQVYARIRPFSKAEAQQHKGHRQALAAQVKAGATVGAAAQQPGIQAMSPTEVGVYDSYSQTWKGFAFDRVWGPETSQLDLFLEVEPLALGVVDGINCCILAYGQTGSGKTHTMHGGGSAADPSGFGLSYRTVHKIFSLLELHRATHAETGHSFEYAVKVAMLEVYNDDVRDLLSHAVKKGQPASSSSDGASGGGGGGGSAVLELRQGSNGEVVVPGLSWVATSDIAEAMAVFDAGNSARATAATQLNIHSSRSHMVMVLEVSTRLDGAAEPTTAKLHLVDLAGSERVKQSEAAGERLKEAQHINKSLSALGDVMEALDAKAKFVPFRNTKLTYLLQGCLGGGCRTAMVVTCCPTPHTVEESNFTLQFGVRCRRVGLGGGGGGAAGGGGGPPRDATHTKNLEEALRASKAEVRSLSQAKLKLEARLNHQHQQQPQQHGGSGGGEGSPGGAGDSSRQMAMLRQLQSEKAELRGALTALRADLSERDATIKALTKAAAAATTGGAGGAGTAASNKALLNGAVPPPPPPPKHASGAHHSTSAAVGHGTGSGLEGSWAPKSSSSYLAARSRSASAQRRDPSPAKALGHHLAPPTEAPTTTDLLAAAAANSSSSPRSSSSGGGGVRGHTPRGGSAGNTGSVERRTRRGLVSHHGSSSPSSSALRRANSGSGAVQSYTQSLATTTAARSSSPAATSPSASSSGTGASSSPPPPPPPSSSSSSSSSIRSFMRMRQSGLRGTSKDNVRAPATSHGGGGGDGQQQQHSSSSSSGIEAGLAAAAAISSIVQNNSRSSGSGSSSGNRPRSSSSGSNSNRSSKPSTPSSSSSAGGPASRRVSSTLKAAREGSPIRALAGRLAAPAPRSRGSSPVGSSGRLAASPRNSEGGGTNAGFDGSRGGSDRRSNSASRFFGRSSGSSTAVGHDGTSSFSTSPSSSSGGAGPALRPRSDSTEAALRRGNDPSPSPATRRADAAKKHAARMQAVRASSGKGRWGNSV